MMAPLLRPLLGRAARPLARLGRWTRLGALAAVALAGAGCKSEAPATPPAAGATAASTAAQVAAQAGPLLGRWVVDLSALLAEAELPADAPPELKARAQRTLAGLAEGTAIELGADASLKLTFGKSQQKGTFSVQKVDGGTFTLQTTTPVKGEDAPKVETVTAVVADDRLTLTGADGRAMKLLKVGSAAEAAQTKAIAEQAAAHAAQQAAAALAAASTPGSAPASGPEAAPGSAPAAAPGSAPEAAPGSAPGSAPEAAPASAP